MSEQADVIEITVNGKPRAVEAGATVAVLLASLGIDPRQSAVERNLELVPRGVHGATVLEAGDRVEVVTLVGGG
jgi:thiamine biosynthesis protein ThiS